MTAIDWKPVSESLKSAIAEAGAFADLGNKLLGELNTAGKAYDFSGHVTTRTELEDVRSIGVVPPATLAAVDKLTREGLGFFGIDLTARNLGPWSPGETNVGVLGGRLDTLRSYADGNSFWKQAVAEAEKLIIPPVITTRVPIQVVTGNPSPAATCTLNAVLKDVNSFIGLFAS